MLQFRISAVAQGLYEVRPAVMAADGDRPLLAKISNDGRGRWYLYRVQDEAKIGDAVDVTHVLHKPAELDRAIAGLLGA